jgi:hypothetical protein
MSLGKLDLASGEESLEVFFDSLLAMETNDFPDAKTIRGFRRHPAWDF